MCSVVCDVIIFLVNCPRRHIFLPGLPSTTLPVRIIKFIKRAIEVPILRRVTLRDTWRRLPRDMCTRTALCWMYLQVRTEAGTKWTPFLQTTVSKSFSWMKVMVIWLKFHSDLFPGVQSSINHRFRKWFGEISHKYKSVINTNLS